MTVIASILLQPEGCPRPSEFRKHNPPPPASSGSARILKTKRPVHIPDLMAEEDYQSGDPSSRAIVDLGGARTALAVPLLKDEAVVGFIMIYRQEVQSFSDKQIALLENF